VIELNSIDILKNMITGIPWYIWLGVFGLAALKQKFGN
jgi:hypothetical protein